jgi:hypothetical protein
MFFTDQLMRFLSVVETIIMRCATDDKDGIKEVGTLGP